MNSLAVYGWEIEKNIFPLRAFKRNKTCLIHFTKCGFIALEVRA